MNSEYIKALALMDLDLLERQFEGVLDSFKKMLPPRFTSYRPLPDPRGTKMLLRAD